MDDSVGSVSERRPSVSTWAMAALLCLGVLAVGCAGGRHWATDLFLTADQQGRWFWERGEHQEAAARFDDPLWRGIALYTAGDLEAAIGEFARLDTAEAWFGQGNSLTHLERYEEAVVAYERAVELRPDWSAARENQEYVKLFIPFKPEGGGGDMGAVGDVARPDEVTFDADPNRLEEKGKETVMEESVLTDEQLTEMWLTQVETTPTDFLGHKFAYQEAVGRQPSGGDDY